MSSRFARSPRVLFVAAACAFCGCGDPMLMPVLPPGIEQRRVAPAPFNTTAEALGEQPAGSAGTQPLISTAVSPSTPVGQPKKTESGLTYVTLKEGTGPEAMPGKTVTVHYIGTLEDGKKFDASYDRNEAFTTKIGSGAVIKGWDEGIPGMKVGEKRRLTIPSQLGYGAAGQPPAIPGNSTLVFEVELLDVK